MINKKIVTLKASILAATSLMLIPAIGMECYVTWQNVRHTSTGTVCTAATDEVCRTSKHVLL